MRVFGALSSTHSPASLTKEEGKTKTMSAQKSYLQNRKWQNWNLIIRLIFPHFKRMKITLTCPAIFRCPHQTPSGTVCPAKSSSQYVLHPRWQNVLFYTKAKAIFMKNEVIKICLHQWGTFYTSPCPMTRMCFVYVVLLLSQMLINNQMAWLLK